MADDTIINFPRSARPKKDGPLAKSPAYRPGHCKHARVEVDPELALVRCMACKEQLNPIWVLTKYAEEDWRLWDRWVSLRALCKLLATRQRTCCTHCGKQTRISHNFTFHEMQSAKAEVERELKDGAEDQP